MNRQEVKALVDLLEALVWNSTNSQLDRVERFRAFRKVTTERLDAEEAPQDSERR